MSYQWLHIQASLEAVQTVLPEKQLRLEGNWVKVELEYKAELETFYAQQEGFANQAAEISRNLQTTVLASLNFDDELLMLWAYQRGELVFQYDSNPMVLGCPICSYSETSIPAEVSDVKQLTRLFNRTAATKEIKSWLVRGRGLGFLYERQRHGRVLELLGLGKSEAAVAVR